MTEAVVLHKADVPSFVAIGFDQSIEAPRKDRGRAIIEKDLQAACCSSKATARWTDASGIKRLAAATSEPSALAASAKTPVGTPVASSIGWPN